MNEVVLCEAREAAAREAAAREAAQTGKRGPGGGNGKPQLGTLGDGQKPEPWSGERSRDVSEAGRGRAVWAQAGPGVRG